MPSTRDALLSLTICLSLILVPVTTAAILHVPDDYTSIQAAIDDADLLDTVLVQPGTYVGEIVIDAIPVVLASTWLTTGDTSAIAQTILSGADSLSVLLIDDPYHIGPRITGFTITNGHDEPYYERPDRIGGGISCRDAGARIDHVVIENCLARDGGGVWLSNSAVTFDQVVIRNNEAYGSGGGIHASHSDLTMEHSRIVGNYGRWDGGGIYYSAGYSLSELTLENVKIADNTAKREGAGLWLWSESGELTHVSIHNNRATSSSGRGGGIYLAAGDIAFSDVSVVKNHSGWAGGGIAGDIENITWDQGDRCNLYMNTAAWGTDIYSEDEADVYLDTFTVVLPHQHLAPSSHDISLHANHAALGQYNQDQWVAPWGSNTNSGLEPQSPLKNIWIASLRAVPGTTIHLDSGIYSDSTINERFPINLAADVTLQGSVVEPSILDAGREWRVLTAIGTGEREILNTTIQNGVEGVYSEGADLLIDGCLIRGNRYEGINSSYFYESPTEYYGTLTVENSEICNNTGSGIRSSGRTMLSNLSIHHNETTGSGGGLGIADTLYLANVSITENRAGRAGGMLVYDHTLVTFDPENRCSIYDNHAALSGKDILLDANYHDNSSIIPLDVFLDTASVATPQDRFMHPVEVIRLHADHGVVQQVREDLYVSPDGNDNASGSSENDPLRTINEAFARVDPSRDEPIIVHLAEGIYGPNYQNDLFPLLPPNSIRLEGAHREATILDACHRNACLIADNLEKVELANLTLSNTGGWYNPYPYGERWGAAYLENSNVKMEYVTIRDNDHDWGSAIYGINSDVWLDHVAIVNNTAEFDMLALFALEETNDLILTNCTIAGNRLDGRGLYAQNMNVLILNSILYDGRYSFYPHDLAVTIHSCLVTNPTWYHGENLIVANPGFLAPSDVDYRLRDTSICIDAGLTEYNWNGMQVLDFATGDYLGNGPDLGAYEYGHFRLLSPTNGDTLDQDTLFHLPFVWEDMGFPENREFALSITVQEGDVWDTTLAVSGLDTAATTLDLHRRMGRREWEEPLTVTWKVLAANETDTLACDWPFRFSVPTYSGVADREIDLPQKFALTALYPNPFNPVITAEVALPRAAELEVRVYDLLGREVAVLARGIHAAGHHRLTFDGSHNASGVYFLRVRVPGEMERVEKMVLLK